ncbi:MAG: hypothetical protein BGO76_01685 [Caedibacter sp. 38-128]|nr:hypothetical protein [Holosporales bacterium]OJX05126.1 MAG: hypothetical protein BGO76_01685 [Caedibacter sp. 38-128]
MSRKKINFDAKIKLSNMVDSPHEAQITEKLNIINHTKNTQITSFRLRQVDVERLDEVLKKANEINMSHPFTRTSLVRGLLMLAVDSNPKKLLEYIRKSL